MTHQKFEKENIGLLLANRKKYLIIIWKIVFVKIKPELIYNSG